MRDSQSLLEQLLAFGKTTITAEDVHQMLGTTDSSRLLMLLTRIAARDAAGHWPNSAARYRPAPKWGRFGINCWGYCVIC